MKNGATNGRVSRESSGSRPLYGVSDNGVKVRASGKWQLLSLDDLDHRSRSARLANQLVADLVADMGGEDNINAAQYEIIRRAALLGAVCGDIEATWLTTKDGDLSLLGTLADRQRRMLESLGLHHARKPRDVTPSLKQYLNNQEAAE